MTENGEGEDPSEATNSDEIEAAADDYEAFLLTSYVARDVSSLEDLTASERQKVQEDIDVEFGVTEQDYPETSIPKVRGGERIVDSPEGVWSGLRFASTEAASDSFKRLGKAARFVSLNRADGVSIDEIIDRALTKDEVKSIDKPSSRNRSRGRRAH